MHRNIFRQPILVARAAPRNKTSASGGLRAFRGSILRPLFSHFPGLRHFSCSIFLVGSFGIIWRMRKTTKLAFGPGLIVQGVAFRGNSWVVSAEGKGTRSCPGCGEASRSPHSWRVRRLQELPIQGVPATLEIRSGRWKCRNEQCARKTFAETLAIALPFARTRARRRAKHQRRHRSRDPQRLSLSGKPRPLIRRQAGKSRRWLPPPSA